MKRTWPLVALGIGAYLLFAIVTLPASVALSFFHPPGVTLSGVSGTIWKGRAQAVRSGALHVGSVDWDLDALALLTGKLGADVKVTRSDGFAQGSIALSGARITMRELNASLPLSALPQNLVRGWTGTATIRLAQLVLENEWPVAATGTIEVADVVGPADRPTPMGGYRVVFAEGAAAADGLKGALSDTGDGPLAVNGTVEIRKDRTYLVRGLVAARPGAPSDMARQLEILGAPDEQGRREFVVEASM